MKLDADFVEKRLLPLVLAFGAGVVLTVWSGERENAGKLTGNLHDNLIVGVECVPDMPGVTAWIAPQPLGVRDE